MSFKLKLCNVSRRGLVESQIIELNVVKERMQDEARRGKFSVVVPPLFDSTLKWLTSENIVWLDRGSEIFIYWGE